MTPEEQVPFLRIYLKAWERTRQQIERVRNVAPGRDQERSVDTVLLLVDEIIGNCEALIEDLE